MCLMAEKQRTIGKTVSLSGKGLHSGAEVKVTFKPAPENHGYIFKRIDLENQPAISGLAEHVVHTDRGTTLEESGVKVYTTEHALAAVYGLGIDNILIEVDGPEMPILDGSSKYFLEALSDAGVVEQEAEKNYLVIQKKITFRDEENDLEISIYPDDKFSVDVHIDYNSKVLGYQYASIKDISEFEKEIAPCRTFVFLHELEILLKNNLIKGGDLENAIIIMDRKVSQEELDRLAELFKKPKVNVQPEGVLNNLDLYFSNEPARHKLLDVIGDLALVGRPIKGKVVARKPGHYANTELAKLIRKEIKLKEKHPQPPEYDPNKPPLYDILEIQKRLPHRPPFLLVDKITYMDKWTVCGIKNVTMNETFFVGHYPDEPIMPGVLQIEAMAQTGGILLLSFVPDPENYVLYFLKVENIKFKRKVVPGDTLNIRMTLKEPVKRGIAYTVGHMFVGENMVIEGEFMAQLAHKGE
jgi:UDP-3-O-[3-hydroxymyristoyl] N-acetylglucosamine deacetylase / 3-hydroxyacyl-[acyl-carrier-protein] dehydratase